MEKYSKKFNRRIDFSNNAVRPRCPAYLFCTILVLLLGAGCGPGSGAGSISRSPAACRDVNELLALAGRGELAMSGRATMDINQYRVRGRFSLYISSTGDITLEYSSSGVMGGGREDIVFAFASDTLRVLDRERGEYYEGDEVVELIAGATDDPIDVAELIRRITARPLDCDGLEYHSAGPSGEGRSSDGRFKLRSDARINRLIEARWHLSSLDEEAKITYRWDGPDRLTELTIEVPAKRWRIRLQDDS